MEITAGMKITAGLVDGTWVTIDLGTADVYEFDRLIRAGTILPAEAPGGYLRRVNLAQITTYSVEADD